jgi:hypothetical protein
MEISPPETLLELTSMSDNVNDGVSWFAERMQASNSAKHGCVLIPADSMHG